MRVCVYIPKTPFRQSDKGFASSKLMELLSWLSYIDKFANYCLG